MNTRFLNPYLDSLARSNFANGANFAIVGSSTLPKYVPFSLNIQVMQFLHFKARALELVAAGKVRFFKLNSTYYLSCVVVKFFVGAVELVNLKFMR